MLQEYVCELCRKVNEEMCRTTGQKKDITSVVRSIINTVETGSYKMYCANQDDVRTIVFHTRKGMECSPPKIYIISDALMEEIVFRAFELNLNKKGYERIEEGKRVFDEFELGKHNPDRVGALVLAAINRDAYNKDYEHEAHMRKAFGLEGVSNAALRAQMKYHESGNDKGEKRVEEEFHLPAMLRKEESEVATDRFWKRAEADSGL